MGNKQICIALLTFAIITIPACNRHKNVEKELTAGNIEAVFKLCPDDTLACIGFKEGIFDFIDSNPFETEVPITDFNTILSSYMAAATILGIDYNKEDITISSINSLQYDVKKKIHELYLTSRQDIVSNIAVPYSFSPKITLTDQIKDTPLETFIRQSEIYQNLYELVNKSYEILSGAGDTKRIITKEEQNILNKKEKMLPSLQYVDRKNYAYFSEDKNLCKIYFLSCPEEFCRNNSLFVKNLISRDISTNEISLQNKKKEIVESWKDYL